MSRVGQNHTYIYICIVYTWHCLLFYNFVLGECARSSVSVVRIHLRIVRACYTHTHCFLNQPSLDR